MSNIKNKNNSEDLVHTCSTIKTVINRITIHRHAITAKPVMKLYGFTSWKVETGWADKSSACTSIFLLSSWGLHSVTKIEL